MEKRKIRIISIVLIIVGIAILLNWNSITGNIISEKIGLETNSILRMVIGLGLIIGGSLVFLAREREGALVQKLQENRGNLPEKTDSEKEVFLTNKFKKRIKKEDRKAIRNAVKKIGTGLGKEEQLVYHGENLYSIRSTKGGRILFEYEANRSKVNLMDYVSDHDYDKMLRSA